MNKTIADIKESNYDFKKETQVLGKLDHPNIVKILEVINDTKEHKHLIVMEYANGGTLGSSLFWEIVQDLGWGEDKKMSTVGLLKVISQIANALEYCRSNLNIST